MIDRSDSLDDILPLPERGRADPQSGDAPTSLDMFEAVRGLADGVYVIADLSGAPMFSVTKTTDKHGQPRTVEPGHCGSRVTSSCATRSPAPPSHLAPPRGSRSH